MEKAEAIEVILKNYPHVGCNGTEFETALRELIPELKESEDERIRKRIVEILDSLPGSYWYGQKEKDDSLAYLEKQDHDGKKWLTPAELNRLMTLRYEAGFNDGVRSEMEKQKGQKETHYTKRSALFDKCVKNCDPAVMKKVSDEVDEMLQKDHFRDDAKMVEQKSAEWSEEDERMLERAIHIVAEYSDIDEKESEIVQNWLNKSLRHQPKQEWNEEDERMLNEIKQQLRILQSHISHSHSESMSDQEYSSRMLQIEKCVSWLDIRLKSLRPSWKPSEEQMEAFKSYIEDFQARAEAAVGGWNNFDVMIRLYEQLKKL